VTGPPAPRGGERAAKAGRRASARGPEVAPGDLYRHPNALAADYSRFRVAERLLLTGHSHQAWPDRGFEGQQRAWLDAAELVDEKWERAFERADRVREGFARLLAGAAVGDGSTAAAGDVALGASTHDLLVRFLSALPLGERTRLVTTDGEFHTLRRQLTRLEEEGLEVVRVAAHPAASVGARVAEAVDDRTAAAFVSSVFFETAHIAGELEEAMRACRLHGALLLVDAYHALNVLPFSLAGIEDAFVIGGGYKYCQLGEGNCFLRVPPGCSLRPVVTGWFAEFGSGSESPGQESSATVRYPTGPARWAGSTYDPTSHYRAAEVFDFFTERGLTPEKLREVSRHQVELLATGFDALDLDPRLVDRDRELPLEGIGGFLALRSPRAGDLRGRLRGRGVLADHRRDRLRLGPAPYLSDLQLRDALAALGESARALAAGS
jgi:kynureninase